MSGPAEGLRIHRLSSTTPTRRRRALDRILGQAERALVSPREHLAPVDERVSDAEADPSRIVLYAVRSSRTVGLVDATLHTPLPGDVTIAQLAIRANARGLGIGSALVGAVLARAATAGAGVGAGTVHAAVLPDNHRALTFWEGLGLEILERDPRSVLLGAPAEVVDAALGRRG